VSRVRPSHTTVPSRFQMVTRYRSARGTLVQRSESAGVAGPTGPRILGAAVVVIARSRRITVSPWLASDLCEICGQRSTPASAAAASPADMAKREIRCP